MGSLAEKRSLTGRHRPSSCASRQSPERPIVWAAASFLGVTALFLPLYDRMLKSVQTAGERSLILGAVLLGIVLLTNLLRRILRSKRKVCAVVSLVLLAGSISLLWNFVRLEQLLPKIQPLDGQKVEICAEVLEWDVTDYGSKYLVRVKEGGSIPKGIKARLYSFHEPAADEGDIIRFCVPLETEIKNYDRSRNIFFYAFGGAEPIELVQERETVRQTMIQQVQRLYENPVLGVVEGVLFGEKQNLEEPVRQLMEGAGMVHILAVSGIHISLMAMSCAQLLKLFSVPNRLSRLLVLLPVWGYIALAQFSPSAVRAGIMATVGVLGWMLHRESDSLSALAAAAMGIIAVSPFAIYSVSFQLSFVVTLGIILCTSPLSSILKQSRCMSFLFGHMSGRMEKMLLGVCHTIAATISATVFSMPVMLYYFHYTAVWGIFASVLALWAAAPLMILAMLSVLFGMAGQIWIFALLAEVCAGVAGIFARWILLVSKAISSLPYALIYSHAPEFFWCGIVIILLFCIMRVRFFKIAFFQRKQRLFVLFLCSVFCLCSVGMTSMLCAKDQLFVFRTDNVMILTRNGQAAVVGDICSSYEAGEVETILRCEGVESMELLLCDSETTDESEGIDLLLQKFPVKVAAVASEGNFSAHIEKALGSKPVDPQNLSATLLGGVEILNDRNGVQILAGEKKLLKLTGEYDIMEQDSCLPADLVMDETSWVVLTQEDRNLGIFRTLEEYPVVKIRMNG